MRAALLACALLIGPVAASAAGDPRLASRLDPVTGAEIQRIVDGAHAHGLPTESLVSKALEGAAKHAPGERIVQVVRAQATALEDARAALAPVTTDAECVAGAGALLAGVSRDTLARMREACPQRSLVVPLVVLADLVARRVPPEAASTAVLAAALAGARDGDLLRLRERVGQDIAAGVAPAHAARTRARALLLKVSSEPNAPARRAPSPTGSR